MATSTTRTPFAAGVSLGATTVRTPSLRSTATVGSAPSRIVVEEEVPAAIELEEFPAEIVTEVPVVRTYRYFRQDNDVFVVDPVQRRVIEIIR